MLKKELLLCSLLMSLGFASNQGAFALFRNKCCDPCDPCCDARPRQTTSKKVEKPVVQEQEEVISAPEAVQETKTERVIEQEPGLPVQEEITKPEKKENNYYPGLW